MGLVVLVIEAWLFVLLFDFHLLLLLLFVVGMQVVCSSRKSIMLRRGFARRRSKRRKKSWARFKIGLSQQDARCAMTLPKILSTSDLLCFYISAPDSSTECICVASYCTKKF